MPPRVYSERLLHGNIPDEPQSLQIPTGKRAVVRAITLVTYAATLTYFQVTVSGVPVLWLNDVPAWTTKHWELRAVAYADELVQMNCGSGSASWTVNGFLFDDP